MNLLKIIPIISFLFLGVYSLAKEGENQKISNRYINSISYFNYKFELHNDSLQKYNFSYLNKKQGIKPYIAPTILIATGTILHLSKDAKYKFQNYVRNNFTYSGSIDDYIQYAPLAAVYSLNLVGIQGRNNFGNRTALALKSILLNDFLVSHLKRWTGTQRPNGGMRSFPSGHTSFAFAMAQFMHHEYGERSIWYSVGAYSCATTVGIMRVAQDAHWISDVIAGAGVGILSTELVYITHLYKWDNEHIKNLDIFPFKTGNQKGITLVYSF